MEQSKAGTGAQLPALGASGGIDRGDLSELAEPAQHGPGPPASSTMDEGSASAYQPSQQPVDSPGNPTEQQIGQLQAELAAVKLSLATYESTLQQLLGAQLPPSTALQQLQQQMQASQVAQAAGEVQEAAARALPAQVQGCPQKVVSGMELQQSGSNVLKTSRGSLGSSIDTGFEGPPMQQDEDTMLVLPQRVPQQQWHQGFVQATGRSPDQASAMEAEGERHGLELEQPPSKHEQSLAEVSADGSSPVAEASLKQLLDQQAAALLFTAPEGIQIGGVHAASHLPVEVQQQAQQPSTGLGTPPTHSFAADTRSSSAAAVSARLQSSASAPLMSDTSFAAAPGAGGIAAVPSPGAPSAPSIARPSSSSGMRTSAAMVSPSGSSGYDFMRAGSSPAGLLPGAPEALFGSLQLLPPTSPGFLLSPVLSSLPSSSAPGGSGGGGGYPPLPAAQRQSVLQPGSFMPPPSGSGGLLGSSSGGYGLPEAPASGLTGQPGSGQQLPAQQPLAVGPSLSHPGLAPDTAGSLGMLSPHGLATTAAAAAAAASTAGSFSLMSAVLAGSSGAAGFEHDVLAGSSSGGDQFGSLQLPAMQGYMQQHGQQDAEQYLLAQQLQQQISEAGYAGAFSQQTEQLIATMQQYGITDPTVAAAVMAATAPGQPGGQPSYQWDQAAAAAMTAASVGLDPAQAAASVQAQHTAQALAHMKIQARAAAQAEQQLQAYQQAQLMQQLQQQYSQPYAQQLLVAQAAAAAAAAATLRQQQQWPGGRSKLAAAHSGSSSGGSRRSSRGTDVHPSGARDARKSASGRGASGSGGRSSRSSDEAPDWRRVFVGNIGWWVDEDMLKRVFGEYGSILDAQVMWNTKLLAKGKRVNREFAFISFATPEEAGVAIKNMHGRYIEGITKDRDGLTVQYEAQGIVHKTAPAAQQQQQLPPTSQQATIPALLQQQQQLQLQQQQQRQVLHLQQQQEQPGLMQLQQEYRSGHSI